MENLDLAKLAEQISAYFNKSEFYELAYLLNVRHEDLPGETISELSRELVEWCRRHQILDSLISGLREQRPQLKWELEVSPNKRQSSQKNSHNWDGDVYNLPRGLNNFVGRKKEIERIIEYLDFNRRNWGVAIDGIAGIGKTSLANEIVQYFLANNKFNKFIWTSAKTQSLDTFVKAGRRTFIDYEGLLDEIISSFALSDAHEYPLREKRNLVEILIQKVGGNCLLVIDNLESVANFEPIADFLNQTLPMKTITTTRKVHLGYGEHRITLRPFDLPEAQELLGFYCERINVNVDADEITSLYNAVGGIPLALLWSIKQFTHPYRGNNLPNFLKNLRNFSQARNENQLLNYCFEQGYNLLSSNSKTILHILALIAYPIALDTLQNLAQFSNVIFTEALDELDEWSYLDINAVSKAENLEPNITILPLTRIFARNKFRTDQNFITSTLHNYADYLSSIEPKSNHKCVFTPDFEPLKVPKNSTCLDFAYYLHTEIGHRFSQAVVNSKEVRPEYVPQNGDIVQIVTANEYTVREGMQRYIKTKKSERSIRTWTGQGTRSNQAIRRGNTLSLQCNIPSAESEFLKAVSLNVRSTWALNKLGHLMRLKGNDKESHSFFSTSLSIEPNNAYALEGLGNLYYQEGKVKKATKLFLQALNIKSNHVNTLCELAKCYCYRGNYLEAFETLSVATNYRVPLRKFAYLQLIYFFVLLNLERQEEAIDSLEKSLHAYNKIIPIKRLHQQPYYGNFLLYYYAIALACAGSTKYSEYLERAISICKQNGVISFIIQDMTLFKGSIEKIEQTVLKEIPEHTISDKFYWMLNTLKTHI